MKRQGLTLDQMFKRVYKSLDTSDLERALRALPKPVQIGATITIPMRADRGVLNEIERMVDEDLHSETPMLAHFRVFHA